MTGSSVELKLIKKCKNCGAACNSNFCPDCGQSVSEKRLDNKTFFIGIISGLSRINKGFLFTSWHLLIHPWIVIRDYIHCRRVRYIAPVSILILVCFISAFIGTLIASEAQSVVSDMSCDKIPVLYRITLSIGHFFINNALAQNLTIYVPALLAIPVVYRKVGAKKYNLAEYFTAMIYLSTSCLLFDIITLPLSALSEPIYSTLSICYSVFVCASCIFFAFPLQSKKQHLIYFAAYLLTVFLVYLSLAIIIGSIIEIGRSII